MSVKRIRKDQLDSGKRELPRKLSFLVDGKVDFLSITHDEESGDLTVELSASAVKALAKKAVDLKALKAGQKDIAAQAALVPQLQKDQEALAALRESATGVADELRKAQRRIKALEKQLATEPAAAVAAPVVAKPSKAKAEPKPEPKAEPEVASKVKPKTVTKGKAKADVAAPAPAAPAVEPSPKTEAADAAPDATGVTA